MKRVNLFCGHYGSGKTNIAVNYALFLKRSGYSVAIADIDVVNPYYRTKDSEEALRAAGIEVISSAYANSNVDVPALPSQVYALVQNQSRYAVFDVGGDDRGALALGRYVPDILEENNYDMFFVANFFRPLTGNAGDALEVMREIEGACGLPFTGIINNSNLGSETTVDAVTGTFGECEKLCSLSALPLVMTTADESLAAQIPGAFPLKLQKRPFE